MVLNSQKVVKFEFALQEQVRLLQSSMLDEKKAIAGMPIHMFSATQFAEITAADLLDENNKYLLKAIVRMVGIDLKIVPMCHEADDAGQIYFVATEQDVKNLKEMGWKNL